MHPQDTTTPTKPRDRRAEKAAYRQEHKQEIAAYSRVYGPIYRQQHKEQIAAYQAAYREGNGDRIKAQGKVYRQENKERRAAYVQRNKERLAAYNAAYRRRNPERTVAWHRLHPSASCRRLRAEMMVAYGGKCVACGETESAFLQLDHVNGGGRKDQRESGGTYNIHRRMKSEGWPPNYQLLCANCNQAKEMLNRPRGSSRTAILYQQLRAQALQVYGGKCTCCGEANPLCLQIDHTNGDGAKDRRESGSPLQRWLRLRREGWSPDYQVLCANCNMAKERPGGCPHQAANC